MSTRQVEKKILLVEDDPALGYVIKDNLEVEGYNVIWCQDGEHGHQCFVRNDFDMCILDIMLPRKDGFTLAREIRSADQTVPILFLTAKSMLEDKLEGFRLGADDYLCKPFSMDELLCRMEVSLRRQRPLIETVSENIFRIGQFEFDSITLTLRAGSDDVILTTKEAELLRLLYANRNRVLKREEILKRIWGSDDYFNGRSMDVFISRLRKYLKADPAIQIVNYHGVGFRLEEK